MTYAPAIEASLYEHWPDTLRRLSIPTLDYCLSREDTLALGSIDPVFREQFGLMRVKSFSPEFENWLGGALAKNKEGSFIKTSYGSFRECPLSYKPTSSLRDAMSVIRWPDSRIQQHAFRRMTFGGNVVILIRPWRDVPTDAEFRIFFRNGMITAITPIHCDEYSARLFSNALQINSALRSFMDKLRDALPFDPIAVDVHVVYRTDDISIVLTELTPYVLSADAGLFDHSKPKEFTGGFRFKTGREIIEMDASGETHSLSA